MKLLYLCLFLLQISISLSSLSTFHPVDTNIKTIKISKNFITCLKNSTLIPERFLKQIESMNSFPITNIDLLSHSFDRKELNNIRYIINNCTLHLPINYRTNRATEETEASETGGAKEQVFDFCSPSELTECLLPYIELDSDKNELNKTLGTENWEDKIRYVLDYYKKEEMYDCVDDSFCGQFDY